MTPEKKNFMETNFIQLVKEFFEGGNHREKSRVGSEMTEIFRGLSEAYDELEKKD